MEITEFKKKKMKLLLKEQQEWHENANIYYICQEKFENKYLKDKKYRKVRDHYHYTKKYRDAPHSICNLKYSVPKQISLVSHKESNYNYHFIIKELAEEFKNTLLVQEKTLKKYITLTVPI